MNTQLLISKANMNAMLLSEENKGKLLKSCFSWYKNYDRCTGVY